MTFNNLMHPRNIYCKPPDFKELASTFPEFAKCVTKKSGKIQPDFKDPRVIRSLTVALLKKDFDLTVEIPDNCLIPTVPQRLNYILWVEDLLTKVKLDESVIKGIDIGTGPCCIFPLLGAKKNQWQFIATEIVDDSFQCAKKNVLSNNLQEKIRVQKVNGGTMLNGLLSESERYDFCMCNPPFFQNHEQLHRRKKLRLDVIEKEVIVEGGEVAFVQKMLEESLILKDRIRIYSSMLGKKQSLEQLVKVLKAVENIKFTTTEFGQGNTIRWGIAWTFLPVPDFKVVYSKKQKPKPSFSFIASQNDGLCSVEAALAKTITILDEFKIEHVLLESTETHAHLKVTASENTWSHQRRKRREKLRVEKSVDLSKSGTASSNENPNAQNPVPCEERSEALRMLTLKTKYDELKDCEEIEGADEYSVEHSITEGHSDVKSSEKNLLLNCNIALEKQNSDISFNFSCDETSNRQTMHQIYFLMKTRMSK